MKSRNFYRTRNMVYAAMCVALMAVCSWIQIPSVVPFTLQTFAVFVTLMLLGGKWGSIAIASYLILGGIGAPVFAGFVGGPSALFGLTGGYLIGFLFMGLAYWGLTKLLGHRLWANIINMVLCNLICYAFGTAWFIFLYSRQTEPIGVGMALGWCVLPYIIPDMIKLAMAVSIGKVLTVKTRLFEKITD